PSLPLPPPSRHDPVALAATPVVDTSASMESTSEDSISPSSRAPVVLDTAPFRAPPASAWREQEEDLPFTLQRVVASTDAPDPLESDVSRSASALPTIRHRRRTTTHWSRTLWLTVCIAVGVALGGMIARLSTKRSTVSSKSSVQPATSTALAPTQLPLISTSNVRTSSQAVPAPAAEPSAAAPSPPSSAESSDVLPGPGSGYLTVHSSSSFADVYIGL